jgi:hypothetical protein
MVNFTTALKFNFSQTPLSSPPIGILVHYEKDLKLYLQNNDFREIVNIYQIDDDYSLSLTYDKPGEFDSITIIASNVYSSMSSTVPIKFEESDDVSGISWQIILIIVVTVVILLGISFSLYVKCKRKR